MHERQIPLTGAIVALVLLAAAPAQSEQDAATKAQEGEINHWIDYYRKDREPAAAPPSTRQNGGTAEKQREKKKERGKKQGETGKVKE